jgi:hypothetical protein
MLFHLSLYPANRVTFDAAGIDMLDGKLRELESSLRDMMAAATPS